MSDEKMSVVEKWRRLTRPQCREDWGLGIDLSELLETEEGRKIYQQEIAPFLPVDWKP